VSGASLLPTAGTPKNRLPLLEQRIELLEKENELLYKKLQDAYQKLAEAGGQDAQLALHGLVEELRKAEEARRALESKPDDDSETPAAPPQAKKQQKGHKGHGPTPQPNLRPVEAVIELPEDRRACPACAGELVPLGEQFEEYEEVDVIQREYILRKVKRRKYRCRCNGAVVTAPQPIRLIPGGRYSLNFAVNVAVDKYLDHVPLERQVRIMARYGLVTTSQALFDQLFAVYGPLVPTYEALEGLLLEAKIIHADETRWPMLDRLRGSPWFVWARCTPDIAFYSLLDSKSADAGRSLFSGYSGVVVVDGYAVYEKLAKEKSDLRLANCWAHARRKYKDIRENFKKPCDRILSLISQLYKVEHEVPGEFPGDSQAQELRHRLREEKSKPILAEIRQWALNEVGLPKSELGKAVRYMLKRWDALTLFLEDPRIALDNNAAERSLRGPVVGRKVHYGSKSKNGTKVAAVLYTLLETAKLCGVDPAAYLKAATELAIKNPGAVLLPHDFKG
jgi:transposase